MELCQFFIDTNNTVLFALVAFLSVRTAGTIFALVVFFCSTKLVTLYRCGSEKMEPLSVGTDHISFMVYGEIAGSVRVVPVFGIFRFFFIHGELHVLFHTMLLAVQIVIIPHPE